MTFHTDLEYWGIDKLLLDACCAIRHYPEMETRQREYEASRQNLEREECKQFEKDSSEFWFGRYRAFLWSMTEHPDSSLAARVR